MQLPDVVFTPRALLPRSSLAVAVAVVAALFLLPRLVGLGTVLSVDEPLWQARAHQFIEGLATFQAARTFVSGQPGVTAMWLAGLATPVRSLGASQAAVALGTSVLFLLALGLFVRLTSPLAAFAGGVLLALDPFLIAHSRIVHTDALLGGFMLLALLSLALAWRTGARRYWVYAAVATALAGLTKVFGFFLLAPVLLCALAAPRRDESAVAPNAGRTHMFSRRLAWLVLPFALTLLIAWPALLFSPRTPLAFMTQRVILHTQSAPVGSGGSDPWYYPREFVRRLTPTVTVLAPLTLVGLAIGNGRQFPRFPGRAVLGGLLATSAIFVLLLSLSEQKSDRYILIAHASLDLAVGCALVWGANMLARAAERRRAIALVLVSGVAILLLRDVAQIHPHYMAQWNHLLPIPADLKLGWGEGLEEAAAYIRSQQTTDEDLRVASFYPGVLAHFLPGVPVERVTRYEDPAYRVVVLYRSMYGRAEGSPETIAVRSFLGRPLRDGDAVRVGDGSFRLEKTFVINRIPYVWVFRRL